MKHIAVKHIAIAGILITALAGAAEARAEVCSDHAVTARGEPARLEWLAKTKARANWRARVRATPGLGDAFAGWRQAHDVHESCAPANGGTACSFSGIPCTQ